MHYGFTLYLDDDSCEIGDVILREGIRYSVFKAVELSEPQLDSDGNPLVDSEGNELPPLLVSKKAARCYGHSFAKFPVDISTCEYPRNLVYQDSQWRLATDADSMRHAILPPVYEDVPAGELVRVFLHC